MKRLLTVLLVLALAQTAFAQGQATAAQPNEGLAEQINGDTAGGTGMVAKALKWYDANMNYYAVGTLMTIESSFIPFPSEVVIPPAVFVAANPSSAGGMKIWLIVLVGTIGAMLGAFINYYLSRWLGRPIIYAFVDSKVGHMLMLSGEKMERAEKYFNDHGIASTLVGRLIPVVRQLISIPAGLSKMNVGTFALFTFLGAAAWNIILAIIGYLAYKAGNLAIVKEYSSLIGNILLGLLAIFVVYLVAKAVIRKKKGKASRCATEDGGTTASK